MPSSKKPTSGKSDKKESTAAREPIPSTSTAAQEPLFTPGGDIHEHLRTVLRIPTTTDTRGPPTVLYRTAHAIPTRQAAQEITEPYRDREITAAEALTCSLQAGTVYIQPWWSMIFMNRSQWTEQSAAFHQCQRFPSGRRTFAKCSSN